MEKGKIYTCNGCYAFEKSTRICPFGSPAGSISTSPYCSVGIDIIKIKNKYGYKPKKGTCDKPKTITDLVRIKTIFYNNKHKICRKNYENKNI